MKTLIFLLFLPILLFAQNEEEPIVYDFVEVEPQFPGGTEAMTAFIVKHIEYPEQARKNREQGIVYISFVVSKTGELKQIRVRKGVSPLLDAEAVRVISTMPNWIPGEVEGEVVGVNYTLPIHFMLNSAKKDKKATGKQQKRKKKRKA